MHLLSLQLAHPEPQMSAGAGFHLRGQTSMTFEKKPYRIELRDAENEDKDMAVLGMPEESDWILRNPYVDKSLIRQRPNHDLCPKFIKANN